MKKVIIHTDGGCHGNPGPGGWAVTLEFGPHQRELSGGVPATTNNRMELQAAIEALRALKESCSIDFYTDSEYVKNGISEWLPNWKRNGWKTKTRQSVKNGDLWRMLDPLVSVHRIHWHWLKGHAGHIGNERCDALANAEVAKIKKAFSADELKAAFLQFSNSREIEPEKKEGRGRLPEERGRARKLQKESPCPFTSRPDTLI